MAKEYLTFIDLRLFLQGNYYFLIEYQNTEYFISRLDFPSSIGLEITTMQNKKTGEIISYNSVASFIEKARINNKEIEDVWDECIVIDYNSTKHIDERLNNEIEFLKSAKEELIKNGI